MQNGETGEIVAEEVDLKAKHPTGSSLLDAGRTYAEKKGLILLSVRPLGELTKPAPKRRGGYDHLN